MNDKKKKIMDAAAAWAGIALFYGILQLLGITCPIKYLTGISCPGCGMTRAWISLLRLDPVQAFRYHPLFPLPALVLPVWLCRSRIKKRVYDCFIFTVIGLFVIIYLFRMVKGESAAVVFSPGSGLIFRAIQYWFL